MINKIFRVIYNSIRFIGNPSVGNLIGVETSTRIRKAKNGKLIIGKKFRTRHNVEINVREQAEMKIGNNVFINSACLITARKRIVIGDHTIFGPNVMIFDHDHRVENGVVCENKFDVEEVCIGSNVWIGAGTIILKGSKIEDNCIIAAGSIVKGKVERGNVMVQKRETVMTLIRGDIK